MHLVYSIISNFTPHRLLTDQASPIQVDENNGEVDKGILYKRTGNWGGGLTSTFYAFGIFYNFQFHSA